jgi:phosphoribosylglycinamide formyltransferase-1
MDSLRVAVLASGGGSNLNALIRAAQRGDLSARIVLVISNNRDAGALNIAREAGIAARHISSAVYSEDSKLEQAFFSAFEEFAVNFIVLAGYMKMIRPAIIRAFENKILNIHPALLPSFGGKGMFGRHVHQAVLDYGCKVSGVTVHLVNEQYDSGAPVLQRCVPVLQDDTPETLAARVLTEEHKVYAEALQLFAEDRVKISGRRVVIEE